MISPATTWLVGLLVFVGMVAGCGSASREPAEVLSVSEQEAPDLETIRAACAEVRQEAGDQRFQAVPSVDGDVPNLDSSRKHFARAYAHATLATIIADGVEMDFLRGEYERGDEDLGLAREELDAARASLRLARSALGEE